MNTTSFLLPLVRKLSQWHIGEGVWKLVTTWEGCSFYKAWWASYILVGFHGKEYPQKSPKLYYQFTCEVDYFYDSILTDLSLFLQLHHSLEQECLTHTVTDSFYSCVILYI